MGDIGYADDSAELLRGKVVSHGTWQYPSFVGRSRSVARVAVHKVPGQWLTPLSADLSTDGRKGPRQEGYCHVTLGNTIILGETKGGQLHAKGFYASM